MSLKLFSICMRPFSQARSRARRRPTCIASAFGPGCSRSRVAATIGATVLVATANARIASHGTITFWNDDERSGDR